MKMLTNRDSYLSVDEVDNIMEFLPISSEVREFQELSPSDKKVYLVLGSHQLDNNHIFIGRKKDNEQFYQFPRILNDGKEIEINDDIKVCTLIYAIQIYQSSLDTTSTNNIKREKIGRTIETEYKSFEDIDITQKDNDYWSNLINIFISKYLDNITIWRS
jgi:hypothetical protein